MAFESEAAPQFKFEDYTTAAEATLAYIKKFSKHGEERNVTDEHSNFYVNSYLLYHGVFPICRHILFLVSHDKKSPETYLHYLKRRHRDKVKQFNAEETRMMEKNSSDNFTLSLIYKLVPIFSKCMQKNNLKKQVRNFQHLWKNNFEKATNIMNNLNHPPSLEVTQTLEIALTELLNRTKELLDLEQSAIETEFQMIKNKFTWYKGLTFDKVKAVLSIIHQIDEETKFRMELTAECEKNRKICLPIGAVPELDRNAIFYNISLNCDGYTFSCEEIFKRCFKKIVIIRGGPGSGKTTLLKIIVDQWCGLKSPNLVFYGLKKYRMIIPVDCREHSYDTVINLIRQTYPKTMINVEKSLIEYSIAEVKVLVLIDGYDERNEKSESLLQDIVRYRSSNMTIIVSGRNIAAEKIEKIFIEMELDHDVFTINKIDTLDRKIEYLEHYEKQMKDIEQGKLVETFRALPLVASNFLNCPILLAMYAQLYRVNKDFVGTWTTEFHTFRTVFKFTASKIAEDIKNYTPEDRKILATKIMVKIENLSRKLYDKKILFVSEENFKKFVRNCKEDLNEDIDYEKILSFILSPELTRHGTRTYTFYHLTLQELLIAKSFVREIEEMSSNNKSMEEITHKLYGENPGDLSRFSNINKYVVLQLNDENKVPRYEQILKELLRMFETSFEYCADIVLASGSRQVVMDLMANVTIDNNREYWIINSPSHFPVASNFLTSVQPRKITIKLIHGLNAEEKMATSTFIKTIGTSYSGKLELILYHSHNNFVTVDEIFSHLRGGNWGRISGCRRFTVGRVIACLSKKNSMTTLRDTLSITPPEMQLSSDSYEHHFHFLNGCLGTNSMFTMKHTQTNENYIKPLPKGLHSEPPGLCIRDIPAGEKESVFQKIKLLAPQDRKMFTELHLLHCKLKLEDVLNLTESLQKSGYRTYYRRTITEKFNITTFDVCINKDGKCNDLRCKIDHSDVDAKCYRLFLTDKSMEKESIKRKLKIMFAKSFDGSTIDP